uniref:NADH-ubiquinone oxidoreductase chain 6 n=1 Tax=Amolops tuberodepressus TaxID=645446 RepID=A0A0U2PDW6_9NEOB|nr:NADH dehydrogenase subunit 6 [Amolops tuberodepressus]
MSIMLLVVVGLLAVAFNPSPYYAALGLVVGAGVGCLVLLQGGVSFYSLVLFLVYLGGMMVVFAYCAALVAEPYPEAWGSRVVLVNLVVYSLVMVLWWGVQKGYEGEKVSSTGAGWGVVQGEWWGIGNLLCGGGWILFFGGWALVLTLFVVLEMARGCKWGGALRAV